MGRGKVQHTVLDRRQILAKNRCKSNSCREETAKEGQGQGGENRKKEKAGCQGEGGLGTTAAARGKAKGEKEIEGDLGSQTHQGLIISKAAARAYHSSSRITWE